MAVERSDEGAKRLGRKELAPLTWPSRWSSARATDWHPSGGPDAATSDSPAEAGRSDAGQGESADDRSAPTDPSTAYPATTDPATARPANDVLRPDRPAHDPLPADDPTLTTDHDPP